MLTHPLAPALALGLLAAGVAMLWPKMAHGRREDDRMHDHDDDRGNDRMRGAGRASYPSRRQAVSASGLASGLQPGGVTPGGSPGAIAGGIGTGGGSTAGEHTGSLR